MKSKRWVRKICSRVEGSGTGSWNPGLIKPCDFLENSEIHGTRVGKGKLTASDLQPSDRINLVELKEKLPMKRIIFPSVIISKYFVFARKSH